MKKYGPTTSRTRWRCRVGSPLSLFAEGVKLAGKNLTQANVVAQTNKLTAFTANGLSSPVNWKSAGHSGGLPPYCYAYIQVKGTQYVPVFNKGKNVFNCFESDEFQEGSRVPVAGRHPRPQLNPTARRILAAFDGALPRFRPPGHSLWVYLRHCGGRSRPDLSGHRRLQLRLRVAGVRRRVRVHPPHAERALVRVPGFRGLGRGHVAPVGLAFDHFLFRHIPNSNSMAKVVCSLCLFVGIPS